MKAGLGATAGPAAGPGVGQRAMALLQQCWQRQPLLITFCASLLLSALAVLTGNLNRDGMLYVEAANAFLADGFAAQHAVFSWPFLSTLMALLAQVSGLSPEVCGQLLNALLMAVACVLLIDLVRRSDPGLTGWAMLVLLALPGVNEYRNELIREYGAWCFSLLALRLALDWPAAPGWPRAVLIQACVALAVLFRPETAVFLFAILAWQHWQPSSLSRLQRAIQLGGLPLLLLLALLILHALGLLGEDTRLAFEVGRFDFAGFDHTAAEMNKTFSHYAREAGTAPLILALGSLALIPWMLPGKLGIFIVPLGCFLASGEVLAALRRHALLLSALLCHLAVLAVFVLQLHFLSGRYLGLLLLFATPFIALGLRRLFVVRLRWWKPMLGLLMLVALSNVLSLAPSKQHFAHAGAWLAAQHEREAPRVFVGSARTAHHAGWAYHSRAGALDRARLEAEIAAGRYDQLVLDVSRKDKEFPAWLAAHGLHEIQRFSDRKGDAVVVVEPLPAAGELQRPAAASPASSDSATRGSE